MCATSDNDRLQLLSRLLSKHPVGLPSEEIQSFLNTLHQLLTESKRSDVSGWLLECLQALCKCQSCKDQSLFVVEGCRPLWTKVWTATLRTISLHHAEQQGFELICSLVETQLVTADKELWRLLAYGTCQPSRHAVHCLATLLKHCPLPEHLQPSTAIGMTTVTNSNYPLRHQLLKWLLPMDEDIDGGEKTVKVVDRPSCHVLPEVLSALTQRNTSTCNFQSQEMQREDNQFFKHIETVYLKSSFDFSSETCTDKSRATRLDVRYSRIVAVLKSLIKTMETIGNQLLETMSSEVSHVENMIHHCSVVAKVIALLLGYQTIKKDEVIGSKLFEQIRLLMKRISDNVKELRNKRDVDQSSKVQTMSIVVKALTQLYSWHHLLLMSCEMKDGIEWMANNCRKFTSPELIDNLLEIVNTKLLGKEI
ncbi:serine-protein kinase ATM-like [Glandiceps talaboti]